MAYNAYRWYVPDTGRYSRTDPVGLRGGGWAALNHLYTYGFSNPMTYWDLRGLLATRHCTPEQVTEIEQAVTRAKVPLNDPENPCLLCTGDRDLLLGHLDGATYYCADGGSPFELSMVYALDPSDCAGIRNDRRIQDGTSITLVFPQALQPGCGCLEATIIHESSHNVLLLPDGSGPGNATDFTRRCLPCSN